MSLLDGPDTVVIQPRVVERGARAERALANDGGPLTLKKVTVRPLSDVELNSGGTEVFSQKVVVSRTWPADVNGLVTWDGYNWDTIGEPQFLPGSRSSRHYEVRIERRDPADG